MSTSLFLSYGRADDEAFVAHLHSDLTQLGFRVWWDRRNMPGRALSFLHEIREAIDAADRMILVVGPSAVKSDYVGAEWGYALSICKPVNPILRLGDYDLLPAELRLLDTPDFRDDEQYATRLETLRRQITESVSELGKLVAVPELPPHFLARPDALKEVKAALLADLKKPIVVTGTARKTGLQGMGGLGKSVLAAALARDCEVRRAFPDGVMWVSLGTEAAVTARQAQIAEALGDAPRPFEDAHQGKARLSDLLSNKACLLILDDAWQPTEADAFDALGARCRMLLTTRDAGLIRALGAAEHRLDVLSIEQALDLLAQWSGKAINDEAQAVAKECGYLPLALALSGAQARDGAPWADLLDALREADLEFFNHPHGSIMKSLKVSLDALRTENAAYAQRYQDLAVFPEDTAIPEAAILTLWAATGKLNERSARRLLTILSNKALIRSAGPERRFEIHDLQRLYLRGLLPDLQAAHAALLDAYRRKAAAGWPSGPDDGYYFEWLIYHLIKAGEESQVAALLSNFEWLQARLDASDANSLLSDFDLLPENAVTDGLQAIESALRLSAHILNGDKTQLASQLIGRLSRLAADSPEIEGLLVGARQYHGAAWLQPLEASLVQPGSALLRTLTDHSAGVNGIDLFDEGRFAVSASGDNTLKVWDVAAGVALRTLVGHTKRVNDVAMLTDGKRAVSASWDNTLRVWDVETGAEVKTLSDHKSKVNAVAVAPDGWRIVSASSDRTLKIWDLEADEPMYTLKGHKNLVNGVAITPDGKRVVSASSDMTLKVWELDSGTQLLTLTGHDERVNGVTVAPDGTRVISASNDGTVRVWDINTGVERLILRGHSKSVNDVVVTPDGQHILSASDDNTLKVWELDTGREVRALYGHSWFVDTVKVTPDGQHAVSGSLDRTIKVWNLANERQAAAPIGHTDGVRGIAITPDGSLAITASSDATLKTWDVASRTERAVSRGHKGVVNSVALTPDGKQIISTGWDRTLRTWDLASGAEQSWIELPNYRFNSVAALPDGRLACGAEDNTIRIYQDGQEVLCLAGHAAWVTSVAATPDGRRIVSASHDKLLKVWDSQSGDLLHTLAGHSEVVTSVAVTPDGQRAVSGSWDHTLKVWDLNTGAEIKALRGHHSAVTWVVVTPDGQHAISTSAEYTLNYWDLASGTVIARFSGDGLLMTCAITPDGQTILVGEQSGRLHWLRLQK